MKDEINEAKAEIRARMRATLNAMDDKQRHAASAGACTKLTSLEAFEHAGVVMLYMPMTNEIDVIPAAVKCFRLGKTVCVPRVDWDRGEIDPVEVTSLDDDVLDCDEHGVRVPKICQPILPNIIDLVVVPGLAFDSRGNRLGRGGGYYDRFLKRLRSSAVTVGLIFDQQIVPKVPIRKHDVAVDILVTDRRVTMAKSERTKA